MRISSQIYFEDNQSTQIKSILIILRKVIQQT